MSPKKYDVIVIGSGLGAMAAAARLSKKGRKVLIMEHHFIPGGCATAFGRKSPNTGKNYKFDVALHEIEGLDKHDLKMPILEELGVLENLKFVKVPEFYNFNNSRVDVTLPADPDLARELLTKYFPKEKNGIDAFFRHLMCTRRDIYRYSTMMEWAQGSKVKRLLMTLFHLLPLPLVCFPYLMRNLFVTVGTRVKRCVDNPDLQALLLANLGYYHDDPMTMAMTYFAVAQGGYFMGAYNIDGGGQKLSNYLWKLIGDNGGDRMLSAMATRLLVDKKGAIEGVAFKKAVKGVVDPDAVEEVAYAPRVIAAADPYQVADMLPQTLCETMRKGLVKKKDAISLATIYVALKSKACESLGSKYYSNFIFRPDCYGLDDVTNAIQGGRYDAIPFVFLDNSCVPFSDEDHQYLCTITAVSYAKHWEGMSREGYQKKKEEFARTMFDRVEERLPGFKEQIDIYEVATPLTIARYTKARGGTPYGFAQTLDQSALFRMNNKSKLVKGLYFASAWCRPGGGFTGSIISGSMTSSIILGETP